MKDYIFSDYFKVNKPAEKDIADWEASRKEFSDSSVKKGLRVTLEATHSGMINKNNRLYVPILMKEGVKTWTTKRNKPAKILKHHDALSDPIGVVRDAKYIDTVPPETKDDPDVQILLDKSAELEDQVEAINRLVKSGKVNKPDWRGLGYTQLQADIYDEDAIEKILDGRLDSVSTSFRPKRAICTVCKQDVMQTFFGCGHTPGQLYDPPDADEEDRKKNNKIFCMWIPDEHNNQECSFVTFDADPITSVTVEEDGVPVELPDGLCDCEADDTCCSYKMTFSDSAKPKKPAEPKPETITLSEDEQKVFDIVKEYRPEAKEEDLKALAKKIFALRKDGKYPDQEKAELDDKTAILYALEDIETEGQEVDGEAVAEDMKTELKKMLEEKLITQEEYDEADAKLSTKARKKLSGSTFCGPNRSFPVPDCAHVVAARRLIGRYKGPGNKSSILACVARKAKALGCPSGKPKKKDKEDYVLPSCADLDLIENQDLKAFYGLVETKMKERELLDSSCESCAELTDKLDKEEANHAKTQTVIDVLRDELRFHQKDYEQQVDEYIKLGSDLEAMKITYLGTLAVLSGKYKNLDEAEEAIRGDNLDEQWTVITSDFDIEKARGRLNDGMARNPNDTVDNPGVGTDGDNTQKPQLSVQGYVAAQRIVGLLKKKKEPEAHQLFDKMKSLKVFSEETTFEDVSAVKPAGI